jgi:glycine/D-amino acid oxidase-like deaminating enzyme
MIAMNSSGFAAPGARHYDVVIAGGAVMGSSSAYWLTENADFKGSILVV